MRNEKTEPIFELNVLGLVRTDMPHHAFNFSQCHLCGEDGGGAGLMERSYEKSEPLFELNVLELVRID